MGVGGGGRRRVGAGGGGRRRVGAGERRPTACGSKGRSRREGVVREDGGKWGGLSLCFGWGCSTGFCKMDRALIGARGNRIIFRYK